MAKAHTHYCLISSTRSTTQKSSSDGHTVHSSQLLRNVVEEMQAQQLLESEGSDTESKEGWKDGSQRKSELDETPQAAKGTTHNITR